MVVYAALTTRVGWSGLFKFEDEELGRLALSEILGNDFGKGRIVFDRPKGLNNLQTFKHAASLLQFDGYIFSGPIGKVNVVKLSSVQYCGGPLVQTYDRPRIYPFYGFDDAWDWIEHTIGRYDVVTMGKQLDLVYPYPLYPRLEPGFVQPQPFAAVYDGITDV